MELGNFEAEGVREKYKSKHDLNKKRVKFLGNGTMMHKNYPVQINLSVQGTLKKNKLWCEYD